MSRVGTEESPAMGPPEAAGGRSTRGTWGWVLAVLAAAVLAGLAGHGGDRWLFDLDVYRAAGSRVLSGTALYQTPVAGSGGAVLWISYPPFAALLFIPLAVLSTGAAVGVWMALSAAAAVRSAYLLLSPERAPWLGRRRLLGSLVAVALVVLPTEPGRACLGFGQLGLILMWAVVEDVLGPRRAWSGALVGVAAGVKLTPLVLLPWMWLSGWRRSTGVAAAAFGTTVLAGWVVLAADSSLYWSNGWFLAPRTTDPAMLDNQSWNAVVLDLGWGTAAYIVGAVGVLCVGTAVGALLARRDAAALGLAVVAISGLVAGPISWTHHWVWLPFAAGAVALSRPRAGGRGLVAVMLMAAYWGPREGVGRFLYVLVGIVFLAWSVWIVMPRPLWRRRPAGGSRRHSSTREGLDVTSL